MKDLMDTMIKRIEGMELKVLHREHLVFKRNLTESNEGLWIARIKNMQQRIPSIDCQYWSGGVDDIPVDLPTNDPQYPVLFTLRDIDYRIVASDDGSFNRLYVYATIHSTKEARAMGLGWEDYTGGIEIRGFPNGVVERMILIKK